MVWPSLLTSQDGELKIQILDTRVLFDFMKSNSFYCTALNTYDDLKKYKFHRGRTMAVRYDYSFGGSSCCPEVSTTQKTF